MNLLLLLGVKWFQLDLVFWGMINYVFLIFVYFSSSQDHICSCNAASDLLTLPFVSDHILQDQIVSGGQAEIIHSLNYSTPISTHLYSCVIASGFTGDRKGRQQVLIIPVIFLNKRSHATVLLKQNKEMYSVSHL